MSDESQTTAPRAPCLCWRVVGCLLAIPSSFWRPYLKKNRFFRILKSSCLFVKISVKSRQNPFKAIFEYFPLNQKLNPFPPGEPHGSGLSEYRKISGKAKKLTPGGQFECPAGSYHRVQKSQKPDAKVRFSWPNWPFCLIQQPQCTNWGVLGYWWAPWVPQWPKIDSTRPIFASYPPKKLIFGGGYGGRYAGFWPFGCNWRLSVTTGCSVHPFLVYQHAKSTKNSF